MKQSPRFAIIVGLLCLSFLGTACGSLPTPNPAYPGPEPTLTPRPTGTPRPTVTPVPPPPPRPTRLTPTPQPPPTATPFPTALPLPPSAFYALWVESTPVHSPGPGSGRWGAIWLTDPRDIANRQEVARFDQAIVEAALSPNGQRLALIMARWMEGFGPIRVADLDGTILHQVDTDARQVLWSRDGRSLVYLVYNGLAERTNVWVSIERLDLTTGETTQLLSFEPDTGPITLLGCSGDGRKVYYQKQVSYGKYELWALEPAGAHNDLVTSLDLGEDLLYPLAPSSDGNNFLVRTSQELSWMSADGQTRHTIDVPVPSLNWLCGHFWATTPNKLVLCYLDDEQPIEHLALLNVQSGAWSELGAFARHPSGQALQPFAISPNEKWVAAYATGDYWIHLPTGMTVPVPAYGLRIRFVAWVPRGTGQ